MDQTGKEDKIPVSIQLNPAFENSEVKAKG